jgi:hypothetical protein
MKRPGKKPINHNEHNGHNENKEKNGRTIAKMNHAFWFLLSLCPLW